LAACFRSNTPKAVPSKQIVFRSIDAAVRRFFSVDPRLGRGLASMAIGRGLTYIPGERISPMPEATSENQGDERPCLHCMMVELIDDFFAEYPAAGGEPDTVDTDEVLTAVAKTVAELTSTQNGTIRQQMIEQLMRDIMEYDAEFRQENATGSAARH